MYVREMKIKRGEGTWDKPWKVYSYWQLVRSYRDPETGKVRKQVVAHLGPAKDREHADNIARAKGLLCAIKGCGAEATEELTWRGWSGHQTPVKTAFRRRKYGYLVCPAHLAAVHQWQSSGEEKFPYTAIPLLLRK